MDRLSQFAVSLKAAYQSAKLDFAKSNNKNYGQAIDGEIMFSKYASQASGDSKTLLSKITSAAAKFHGGVSHAKESLKHNLNQTRVFVSIREAVGIKTNPSKAFPQVRVNSGAREP